MSLGIYSVPDVNFLYSSSLPFSVTFDGRIGGTLDKCVYVRNDSVERWYSNIVLSVVDSGAQDITDGTRAGWQWQLLNKEIPPDFAEWEDVTPGGSVSLGTLGSSVLADTVTFLPVWVRVVIPRGQRVQAITSVVLRLSATENVVDG